uniref:Uncharacterized protein n=1 Tax=Anguilla anguilla TaxID=7936 RepID=A0A0E9XTE4_ANGAN
MICILSANAQACLMQAADLPLRKGLKTLVQS